MLATHIHCAAQAAAHCILTIEQHYTALYCIFTTQHTSLFASSPYSSSTLHPHLNYNVNIALYFTHR
jgi:hypothetical protein